MNIKIFRINQYVFFAGETLEECIKEARDGYDEEPDEDAGELSETEAENTVMFDEQTGNEIDPIPFLQQLIEEKTEFPCIFCHSELW